MTLSNKLQSAVKYVHSLMGEYPATISITRNEIQNYARYDFEPYAGCRRSEELDLSTPYHNPIAAMIENVLSDVCTDCLKDEYAFNNPFFVSLIKGYIEVLIHQYGERVPITRTLAQVIVQHFLSEHDVLALIDDVDIIVETAKSPLFKQGAGHLFFLKVKTK